MWEFLFYSIAFVIPAAITMINLWNLLFTSENEPIKPRLEEQGFACSNVALGVGSFSMQCIEEDGVLKPFTRDTFSSCIKATYCEIDHVPYPIFKNPKDGGFKKSQKGCCIVTKEAGKEAGKETEKGADKEYGYKDNFTWREACEHAGNLLETIFIDGKLVKEQSLFEIRTRLHDGKF